MFYSLKLLPYSQLFHNEKNHFATNTAVIIPIKSAISPTFNAVLTRLIPTAPKDTVTIYSVVSVAPCITDAIKPIEESGPNREKMSSVIASAAEPDTGLRMRSGLISAGTILIELPPPNILTNV